MIVLSREQIIVLHSQLIQETGGTEGIRKGLLKMKTEIHVKLRNGWSFTGAGSTKNEACDIDNIRILSGRLQAALLKAMGMPH